MFGVYSMELLPRITSPSISSDTVKDASDSVCLYSGIGHPVGLKIVVLISCPCTTLEIEYSISYFICFILHSHRIVSDISFLEE